MRKLLLSTVSGVGLCACALASVGARYVTVDIPKDQATISISEVEVFVNGQNVAPKGTASQSTVGHDAPASRAIDGNTSRYWRDGSIAHTIDDLPHPVWELDLGAEMPIEKIVLWNHDVGSAAKRLDGFRVTVSDAERKILWEEGRVKAERTNFFVPKNGVGIRAGQVLPTIAEHLESLRLAALLKDINTPALREALQVYAEKYPEAYPNAEALKAEINALEAEVLKTTDASALKTRYRDLQKKVLLAHPAVDFDEMLFIRRPVGTKQGLFQNYQGNTAWLGKNDEHLRGYKNDIVRAPLCQEDGDVTVVKASTAYLGDLCLDWDAEKVLMSSGNEKAGPWRLYEMDVDGKNFHEAYSDENVETDYYDACYLPDGRIITTATAGYNGVPCVSGGDFVANLFLINEDRKGMRRLTFDQDINWQPEVYPNGRVVYVRWEYTDSAHYFSRVMMTMNPDGTDQQEFYGSNSYWPNAIFFAQHLPESSTKFIGIVTGHHGVARKGELVSFDVSKGRIETQGAVHKFPFRGKPIENITMDQLVDNIKPYFLHPRPLNDELVLVAMQDDNKATFRIVLVDIYDNVLTLWESKDCNYYEPIPLKARPRPAYRPDMVDMSKKTCNVYMANVYRGQDTLKGVPKGSVKKLRVFNYEYAPRHSGGHYAIGMEGPWDVRIIHGTVDVEPDGSCMFEFPANTPLSVQPLDENGHALQGMRSWLVGMPGETISCIGCHENQNAAAPSGMVTAASRKPPQQIKNWYGPKRGWSFDREVQPVLDRKCVGCHNGDGKTNALGQALPDFTYRPNVWGGFSGSYIALHPYVRRNGPEGDYHVLTPLEFNITTSDLYQTLKKGHKGVTLTAEEWDRLVTWVDLNVPYYGTWTERGASQEVIQQRRNYERETANLTFDPEKIINPYTPGSIAFESPVMTLEAPEVMPTVEGWPFDGAAKQGARETIKVDVGGGQTITAVKLPAGNFVMGSNAESPVEAPAHRATVEKPIYMGTTEVTMAMMQQFDPTFENGVYDMHYKDQVKRGYFVNGPDFPAIRVSYEQAQAFCDWLSKKSGKKVRLPTETEWEYACRAGTATPMNYGDLNTDFSAHANLADITMKRLAVWGIDPQPIRNPDKYWDYELKDARFNDKVLHLANVGSYAPNAFGLYDMHGNIAEWTSSPFVAYPDGKPSEAYDATKRVVRGGSWYQRQHRATSSIRWGYPMWQRPYNVGFRVVIED